MSEVKRYDLVYSEHMGAGIGVKPSGKYVTHEDYAALQQKLDAVLAGNVALRKAHPQPFGPEMMKAIDAYIAKEDEVPEQGMMDAFFILRDSITLKSAQVDAILNEVRAEGVEKLITEKSSEWMTSYCEDAREYAAQLRTGSTEGGV